MTISVPRDSAARSVGADEVAARIEQLTGETVVRTGSRGMLWLEPLVEVDTPAGRVGYGPVAVDEVEALVAAGLATGTPPGLGLVDALPWMQAQQRLTFARVGIIDPLSADDHLAHGGNAGLAAALAGSPADVVETVVTSGLRGRGGAGFPTGIKWRTVAGIDDPLKFVCCNADEGDSGTFADRMLMEGDPFTLIEGMTIAARAVGASEGYIYIRSEYPDAIAVMRTAIDIARGRNWLGERILGSDLTFDLHVRVGAGAYICGEETSMLSSIEGTARQRCVPSRRCLRCRGSVRAAHGGEQRHAHSLATVPCGAGPGGAQAYADLRGRDARAAPSVFQLAGNVAPRRHRWRPRSGSGWASWSRRLGRRHGVSGRPVGAVQVGGPLGGLPHPGAPSTCAMDYEAFAACGRDGGARRDRRLRRHRRPGRPWPEFAMEFCAAESCGKCTPVPDRRRARRRGDPDRIRAGRGPGAANLVLLDDLCERHGRRLAVRHGRASPRCRCAARWRTGCRRPRRPAAYCHGQRRRRSQEGTSDDDLLRRIRPRNARPGSAYRRPATVTIDGRTVSRARRARPCMRAAGLCRRRHSRSCAPPSRSRRSGRAGSASSRSTASKGTPASCTTPAVPGRHGRAHPDRTS